MLPALFSRAKKFTGTRPLLQTENLSSIEEIIDDARNGHMFILVDDQERENEGDLVIPGQMATRTRSISWPSTDVA